MLIAKIVHTEGGHPTTDAATRCGPLLNIYSLFHAWWFLLPSIEVSLQTQQRSSSPLPLLFLSTAAAGDSRIYVYAWQ